jgi:RNA polymerase sigma-70 factor (ECF subfamily)
VTSDFARHAPPCGGLKVGVGPDRDLVVALRRRDAGAFEDMYRTYCDRIWRLLVRLSGSEQWAEDLFQETWLSAARHAQALREDTALLPWLCTIARNKFRNGVRAGVFERKKLDALAWARPDTGGPDDAAAARLRVVRATAAFSRLPGAHREVLLLSALEGLETADVARVLGITEQAVRKRLSRARADLLKLLADDEGDPR